MKDSCRATIERGKDRFGLGGLKTPQVLFVAAGSIDDGINYVEDALHESGVRYPFFRVFPYSSYLDGQTPWDDKPLFSPALLPQIQTKLPAR